jgi:hypothetical protein
MALIALSKRFPLCKICTAFADEEILNEITLHILRGTLTYKEIGAKYTPLLPANCTPISDVNINSHRKHSSPEALVHQELKKRKEPVTEGEILTRLYAYRYKKELDKVAILQETYRERLSNLYILQDILDVKTAAFAKVRASEDRIEQGQAKNLEREIRSLITQIDDIQASLQTVLIREIDSDNGLAPGSIHITNVQNIQNVFQGGVKGYVDDMVKYLLHEVFFQDKEYGRQVVSKLSQMLDRHITPALDQSKLEISQEAHV